MMIYTRIKKKCLLLFGRGKAALIMGGGERKKIGSCKKERASERKTDFGRTWSLEYPTTGTPAKGLRKNP